MTVHNQVREFRKPVIKTDELTPEAIRYMQSRKISAQTLRDWQVKQRVWNGRPCFVFQYFDQNNNLPFISYREIKPNGAKGGCEPGTMPILWGMLGIDVAQPVVVTEGQIDAMSVWEAGYKNVVSVPSGSNNFAWIDNCWNWLQQVQDIIVWADNDDSGQRMALTLQTRLGKYRTKIIVHNYKDANEVLCKDGGEAVIQFIDNAIQQTPAGLMDMSRVKYISLKDRVDEGIPTGLYGLDSVIDDLQPEELSILFGRNGEGKSTMMSQVICNCIDNHIPVFLYSGEMSPQKILNWLYRQAIGDKMQHLIWVKTKYKKRLDIGPEALPALQKWMSRMFYTFDKTVSNVRENTNDLFEVMSVAAKRYGCRLFIIDNLMSALEDTPDSLNADQSNFVQRCKLFAEAYRVHVILVAHPNKAKTKGQKLEKEDISGSNNIPNKADIVLAIEKVYDATIGHDAILRLLKDRGEGEYLELKLFFEKASKRLREENRQEPGLRKIEYGWEKYFGDEKPWYDQQVCQEECPF
ncbi:MAG: bifunctional DNA primase/helicase [Eubacteriales bacterium]